MFQIHSEVLTGRTLCSDKLL